MCLYNLPENGDVASITFDQRDFSETGGGALQYGIYDSSGNLKGVTAAGVNTAGRSWVTLNFSPALSLTAGDYWLAVLFDDRTQIWYDSGAANQWGTNVDAYSDGFADPMGTLSYNAWAMSIYATYTPTAAAGGAGSFLTRELTLTLPTPWNKRFPIFKPRLLL